MIFYALLVCIMGVVVSGQGCFPDICALQHNCANGATCGQNPNPDCSVYCLCPPTFTGKLCKDKIQYENMTTTSQTTKALNVTVTTPTSVAHTTTEGVHCGLQCRYGVCQIVETELGPGAQCKCSKNYTGSLCTDLCLLECGIGECNYDIRGLEVCNCPFPYYGLGCVKIRATEPPIIDASWKYWVIGSCCLILLVIVLLFIPVYILIQKRNIFVMRILYYFQPYEDDDEKEFDAFISYKSHPADEGFVYDTLQQVLEVEKGFKLCLHERDFTPGVSIVENIINAVQKSRRTILVLSPHYLDSGYAKFEFEKAHDEMIKQKHKVIPLLFEDISSCGEILNKRLSYIIQSITYIEWPSEGTEAALEKFWKRMELSMPKKKSLTSGQSPIESNSVYEIPRSVSVETGSTNVELTSISLTESSGDQNDTAPETPLPKNISEPTLAIKTPRNKSEFKDFFSAPQDDHVFENMRSQSLELNNYLNSGTSNDGNDVSRTDV